MIILDAVYLNNYAERSVSLHPHTTSLPASEFVYTSSRSNSIVFFSPDGSANDEFWLNNNSLFDLNDPQEIAESIASDQAHNIYLRWSEYFQTGPFSGYPIMITSEGEVFQCDNSPFGSGRINPVSIGQILVLEDNGPAPDEVVIFDLLDCEFEETVYQAIDDEYIYEAAVSSTGLLALRELLPGESYSGIHVYDGQTEIFHIPEGEDPTWSHSGTLLAYIITGVSGGADPQLWIYDTLTNETTLLTSIQGGITPPSWAPDDHAIAFGSRDTLVVFDLGCNCSTATVIVNDIVPIWR